MSEATTRICFCSDRIAAMNAGTFRYSPTFNGWWLLDVPTRSMSTAARGCTLPGVRDGDARSPFPQADGGES
jgi:hypothetical protein